jgi:hypothetical protein
LIITFYGAIKSRPFLKILEFLHIYPRRGGRCGARGRVEAGPETKTDFVFFDQAVTIDFEFFIPDNG